MGFTIPPHYELTWACGSSFCFVLPSRAFCLCACLRVCLYERRSFVCDCASTGPPSEWTGNSGVFGSVEVGRNVKHLSERG
jgi:hypothetical protein